MGKLVDLIRNHPEQVNALTALCALFVSFLSIVLTFCALWLQRRHNFKSLTPIAHISANDFENLLEVKIRNYGIGPLLVESFIASRGAEEKHNIIDWMASGNWTTFTKIVEGRCIPAGGQIILVRLEGDVDDMAFTRRRDKVRRSLSELTVSLKYKDIYDRRMPDAVRDLQWFKRNLAGK